MASGIISASLPTLAPALKTLTNSALANTRFSKHVSTMGHARTSGPKHDLNLVTIGGTGSHSSCRSPRALHWSAYDKYGAIDDAEEGTVGVEYATRNQPVPPTADIVVTREVAVLKRNGASVPIERSLEGEPPLRTNRISRLFQKD